MSIYYNNIKVLEETNKDLYDAYNTYNIEKMLEPQVVPAKYGDTTIKVNSGGDNVYLYSTYNPSNEAEKFVKQYAEIPDYAVMVFLGMGNGQVIRKLREEKGENVRFLFYEPSVEIFKIILETYDITDILKDKNIFIYVKGLNSIDIEGILSVLVNIENYRICTYDTLPKYKKLFPDDDAWMEDRYRFAVTSVQSNIATMQRFGAEICKNNIYNLRYILESNCEEDFAGAFPLDMPVIIVAAGPSLEKNVHLLKQIKGHAFIIAVDTALRYLVEQDVMPDLAVSVDPQKPLRLFDNPTIQRIPLALATTLSEGAVSMMSKGKLIYSVADGPYYDTLYQLADKHIYMLPNGGSVATVAVAIALNWGFKRIVLVGQDLALAPDKVHAGNDDVDLFKLEGDKVAVEGYYGDTVYTTWDFNQYREWYELTARTRPELELINATEGGAKIQGAVQMSLQEVKETYCQKYFDFEETIRMMPPTFNAETQELVKEYISRSVRNLSNMKRMFIEGLRSCEEGMRLITRGQFETHKISKINKKIDSIIEKTTGLDEIYFVDCMVSEAEEDVLGDIYDINPDNEQEYYRLLEKLHKYMSAMKNAVSDVSELFDNVVGECGFDHK